MGIKHYWIWHTKNFAKYIHSISPSVTELPNALDSFMLDLNGIFHQAAQRVYKYGAHSEPPRLMQQRPVQPSPAASPIEAAKIICDEIDKLVRLAAPRKQLVLCIDGPAPLAKQKQQRERRFRSVRDKSEAEFRRFDSNQITPGTPFMDTLSSYIEWHIQRRVSNEWRHLEVVFSNEKVPGEGEHKLIAYLRQHGSPLYSYCIYGLDADLIMLALGTMLPSIYVLRQDLYDKNNAFFFVDIGNTRRVLQQKMRWGRSFIARRGIYDFIFMCFLVGNDFLPNVPSLEILQGGIDTMIRLCKQVGTQHGHLTVETAQGVRFHPPALRAFLEHISASDKRMLENKLRKKHLFFPDTLLEAHAVRLDDGKTYRLDMQRYKQAYYAKKFPSVDVRDACQRYLDGVQWVLTYYTQGVPDWKWTYPFPYAPFAGDMAKVLNGYTHRTRSHTAPNTPFQQLLGVLPPKSAGLLPVPLSQLLTDSKSAIREYCPDEIEVDVSGKRKEWEGIVLLPSLPQRVLEQEYFKYLPKIRQEHQRLNRLSDSWVWRYSDQSYYKTSAFGDLPECRAIKKRLQL